ncbi:hypothetical protein GX51_04440 [Blastomyces parvus]|uniref:Uncharacterized protein n=1 Tax=Blastomyces parvus TaxID=2060905 RepID=A0A2B7X2B2_9EURO|nr:hypothetical protein GX51_04440 [Blastomyces parvus]
MAKTQPTPIHKSLSRCRTDSILGIWFQPVTCLRVKFRRESKAGGQGSRGSNDRAGQWRKRSRFVWRLTYARGFLALAEGANGTKCSTVLPSTEWTRSPPRLAMINDDVITDFKANNADVSQRDFSLSARQEKSLQSSQRIMSPYSVLLRTFEPMKRRILTA